MSRTAASTAPSLTPVEEEKADCDRLLTVFVNVCGVPSVHVERHPMTLALKNGGIVHFHIAFIHMTSADIDSLQHLKSGTLVPLELNFKMILRVLLAFYHHESHKRRGGINILDSTAEQFKNFRNTEYNPTKEIIPWGLALSKNEGLSNWNKMVKPSARNFKTFREANNWVDFKDGFMITLEAQNLTHLVNPSYTIIDPDLHKAQTKVFVQGDERCTTPSQGQVNCQVLLEDQDTCVIWQKICKTCDESISTSTNGDAILGWLTGTRLNTSNWTWTQGEHITFYADKVDKFNEMCPDSRINDDQAVRLCSYVTELSSKRTQSRKCSKFTLPD